MSRNSIHTLLAIALLAVVAGVSLGAIGNPKKTTYFTFSDTVRLPGIALPAGTYAFEVANDNDRGDLVRVMNRDRSKVYATQFTYFVRRAAARKLSAVIRLGEARPGAAPSITSWFPQDDTVGRAFIY